MEYDVIGDVHRQADKLEALLGQMGYAVTGGCFRHPSRKAVFVGDFIDGGPDQLSIVDIARRMVDGGSALAVMGNHELNAIAWHTAHPTILGEFLRPHGGKEGKKNFEQHERFLAELREKPALHSEIVDRFLALPLGLELDGLRVVHVCWHQPFMKWLSPGRREGRYLDRDLLQAATEEPADKTEKDNASPTWSVFHAGLHLQSHIGKATGSRSVNSRP